MIDLKDKRVLLIAPAFFGYEKAISLKLQEWGALVDYYDERPTNSFWDKGLIRINKNILAQKIDKYYNEIYSDVQKNVYDYIFVINIEAMPFKFLTQIRKLNGSAKFILYMWDSISNKKNTHKYISFFDVVYSFDKGDSSVFSSIRFRPLFYLDEYSLLREKCSEHIYDISFIGTAHSDRLVILETLKKAIEPYNLNSYYYIYLHSKKLFYWNKLSNPFFKNVKVDDCKYVSLCKDEVLDIINKSNTILDIQHPKQTGLTMRTIEMLGAEKKIITTNLSIKEYDFYKPENIWILDRDNPIISADFFKLPYMPLKEDLYYKYSINGWLEEILT